MMVKGWPSSRLQNQVVPGLSLCLPTEVARHALPALQLAIWPYLFPSLHLEAC